MGYRAYLTGVYCLPEEYGETYTYDNNGNLISAASVSGSSSGYGFASNNLTAAASETGAQNFVGYTVKTGDGSLKTGDGSLS